MSSAPATGAVSSDQTTRKPVDFNTQYTQAYTELRRYRDYELSAAGWFSALQIGLASVLLRLSGPILNYLKGQPYRPSAMVSVTLISLLGVCGVFSVCYSKRRYEDLRGAMKERFEEDYLWPQLPTRVSKVEPFSVIVLTVACLALSHLLAVGVLLNWPKLALALYGMAATLVMVIGAWMGLKQVFSPKNSG